MEGGSGCHYSRGTGWVTGLLAAVILLLAGLPVTLSDYQHGRPSGDQNKYYLKTVDQFAAQWPAVDLSEYPSATTPGWPLALAPIARYVSDDPRLLRSINLALTALMVGLLAGHFGRRVSVSRGLALTLPIVASPYVFSSAAWMLLDNPAWFWIVVMLLLLWRSHVGWPHLIAASGALLLLVFTRQIQLWAAAMVWAAAWLWGRSVERDGEPVGSARHDFWQPDWPRVLGAVALTLPAFGLLAYFFTLWGGLMPQYDDLLQGPNPATPAFTLSLIGMFSIFYLPWLWPHVLGLWRDAAARAWLMLAVLGGLVIGALPVSTYQPMERISGLWNLVKVLPTVGDRSPVIALGSALGAGMLAVWASGLSRRDAVFFLFTWLAFIAAQAASATAWQRYHEPFILIMLSLAAVRLRDPAPPGARRTAQLAGLLVLTLCQAAVTLYTLT